MSYNHNDRELLLATAFVELADTLVDDYDVIVVLDRLVAHSVTLLAADAAGIMHADSHGRLRVVASSNKESDWTELLQVQTDEGPCVDCVRTGQPVTVTDLGSATVRWPRLVATLAGRTIYPSVHALPRARAVRGDGRSSSTVGAVRSTGSGGWSLCLSRKSTGGW